MATYKLSFLTQCFPDYFQGSDLPVIQAYTLASNRGATPTEILINVINLEDN